MTRNIQCVELGKFSVPGMRVRVRCFPQGTTDKQLWRASSNILSFSRVIGEPVLHRDVSRVQSNFQPATPLTFWPRSSVWESGRTGSQVLTVSAYFDSNFTSTIGKTKPEGICVDDFFIMEMMQLLHDEVRLPGQASHELIESIGKILRIKLSRLVNQQTRSAPINKPCRSVDAAILHGLISNEGKRFPTTAQMAKQLNTSRRSLLRLFKETTGTSPSHYIEEAKLESAKKLLATSKMTLKQISYETGYSTPSYFSTKFRQLTGLTPSVFRRLARRDSER